MSGTIWEVPVATPAELGIVLSRRELRLAPSLLPRDARPSRARHERMPVRLRVRGAASRRRD